MLKDQAKELVSQMTLEEKASLCSGRDFWNTKGVDRLGIHSIMVTDGPHGVRKQTDNNDHLGISKSIPATCFPTASATASSWDRKLMFDMGVALAEECLQERVGVLLGPGINIKRNPLCGRNFEYISEDPYVAGELAAALIDGIQEKGVGTSIKHFIANSQEKARMSSNSVIDERTMREIYLAGFEKAIKKSSPWTVMGAYNLINGTYACENKKILTDILRDEWGYEGLVMTDWFAMSERVPAALAGLDLEMPTTDGKTDAELVNSVKNGELKEAIVDRCAQRVVELILKAQKSQMPNYKYDIEEHHKLAQRIASECAVLLKNEGAILPANTSQNVAIIGEFAKNPRYQGAGSSNINPNKLDSAFDALLEMDIQATYAQGYSLSESGVNEQLIKEACETAKDKDIVYIFAGLPDDDESEGFDRTTLAMPNSHNQLIEEVSKVNSNVVVILLCGSPVTMPWINNVKGVLLAYLGGQASGSACVELLYGIVNPSGKLSETFPISIEDSSSYLHFGKSDKTVEYREGIFVGYRWYDTAKRSVIYPFGYGLSYTTFEYSNLTLAKDSFEKGNTLSLSVTVTNTGNVAGSEVVQLYVGKDVSTIYRAEKELKGFEKVFLQPMESKTLSFELDTRSFAYYNEKIADWAIEGGTYLISIGASSRDIRLTSEIKVEGDGKEALLEYLKTETPIYYNLPKTGILDVSDKEFATIYGQKLPPKKRQEGEPYTQNSTIEEIKDTPMGQYILQLIDKMASELEVNDMQKMIDAMVMDLPLRALVMASDGAFGLEQVQDILKELNKHNQDNKN